VRELRCSSPDYPSPAGVLDDAMPVNMCVAGWSRNEDVGSLATCMYRMLHGRATYRIAQGGFRVDG